MERDLEGGGSGINAQENVHSLRILWQEARQSRPDFVSELQGHWEGLRAAPSAA